MVRTDSAAGGVGKQRLSLCRRLPHWEKTTGYQSAQAVRRGRQQIKRASGRAPRECSPARLPVGAQAAAFPVPWVVIMVRLSLLLLCLLHCVGEGAPSTTPFFLRPPFFTLSPRPSPHSQASAGCYDFCADVDAAESNNENR